VFECSGFGCLLGHLVAVPVGIFEGGFLPGLAVGVVVVGVAGLPARLADEAKRHLVVLVIPQPILRRPARAAGAQRHERHERHGGAHRAGVAAARNYFEVASEFQGKSKYIIPFGNYVLHL
jgi:hypothetical protein